MKLKDRRLFIFLSLMLLFTLAACILRTTALKLDFNAETGFFRKEGLITTASVLILIAVLTALFYIFLGKPRKDIVPDFHGAATYIPSGLLALSLIFFAANTAFNSELSATAKPTEKLLSIIAVISALITILYLLSSFFLGRRYSALKGTLALFPIILLLSCAAKLYFDTSMPINAPNKSLDQLAFVFAMLFFTEEARLSLGREKWGAYAVTGLVASALTAYTSVPVILIYFINSITNKSAAVISVRITSSVLLLALFIFITARVAVVTFLTSNRIGKLAAYIDEESVPEEELPENEYKDEYQLSIDDIIENTEENGSERD